MPANNAHWHPSNPDAWVPPSKRFFKCFVFPTEVEFFPCFKLWLNLSSWPCVDGTIIAQSGSVIGLLEPIPVNTENETTVVKFRISSCYAQITSIVSYFRKYHSKVLKRFSFFAIEESSKIAILAVSYRRKWPKIVHFRFARTDQRDDIYHCTPGSS